MKFVVCHEVSPSIKPNKLMSYVGDLRAWFEDSTSASTALGLRMIGFAGFQPFLRADVYECKNVQDFLPKSGKIFVEQALLISFKKRVNLLMIVGSIEANRAPEDFWIQRPGTSKSKMLLSKLGLQPNIDENVYSTCVSISQGNEQTSRFGFANDGNLTLSSNDKNDFVNLATYRMVCLLVSIERQLISSASRFLMTTRPTLWGIVKNRDLLIRWPSSPAIDSTAVSKNYASLRDSINLESRKREVVEALTLLSKRQETVLAVCGLSMAFVTLGVSIWLR